MLENFRSRNADGVVLSERDLEHLIKKRPKKTPKDSESRLKRVKEWWKISTDSLAEARKEMMLDHDYYDSKQWSDEDAAVLKERGQEPVVFNMIATSIDWILGAERRQRMDWHILPKRKEDSGEAEAKTKLLKYISDVSNVPLQRSRAFEDAVKGGVGWLDTGVRSDPTREPVYVEYEDWRNVWYDPLAKKQDLSDGRFLFRSKWMDLDMAMMLWPEQAPSLKTVTRDDLVDQDAEGVDDIDSERAEDSHDVAMRSRIRVIECWYKVPMRLQIMRGPELGVLDGEEFDETNHDHLMLAAYGLAEVFEAVKQKMRVMIYAGDVVLFDDWSPYRHNRFPLVPIWAKRRTRDGSPYGPIRNMRSPQNDLNKRRSKALFILSTNKIIADDNATDDWEEFQDEASRPDGLLRKRPGSEVTVFSETALADAHTQLMDQDAMYIQDASGVTNENLGRDTNTISGKAIEAKQEQGRTVTIRIFDNHRHAYQAVGQILLSLMEQYYTDEKQIRIGKDKGKYEFQEINAMQPDGTILNDITASKADFTVSETDFNDTLRQSLFEAMSEMITRIDPGVAMQLLDMVVDLSDLPGKDAIVARIREINGMDDPDIDPHDEEAMQRKQARDEQKAQEAEMQQQAAMLEIEKLQAEVEKGKATAQLAVHKAVKTKYDAMISIARVDSERVNQQATLAGIDFDQQKLEIEKAKVLSQGEIAKSKNEKPGQHHERGLKSNNKEKK